MKPKESKFDLNIENGSNTHLLRIGVVCLAIVSFFTTANGMAKYIFINDIAIAYAASAAIQGILLALSINLPGYLWKIWEKPWPQEKHRDQSEEDGKIIKIIKCLQRKSVYLLKISVLFLGRAFLCVCSVSLTIIIIFCSSWFSYIYIADIIHQDSWGTDSELLVQQTYRSELYNARDYAHAYRIYLEESAGEKILMIEEQTGRLSDSDVDLTIDWERERGVYLSDEGTTAASYMSTVINAMTEALSEGSSQESRDLAAAAIEDAKVNIADRMESIQQNISTLDANITNYNNQIAGLRNQIDRRAEDTDISGLNNSIAIYSQLINDTTQQQANLQAEYRQLDSALMRLPYYESQLGLSSSTSAISIRSELLQLQSEFFQQEPDEEKLLNVATEIFENLRSAVRQAASGETVDENFSYTSLLVQMNQLIQNLKDYNEIKDIESNLDDLITELRDIDMIAGSDKSSSEAEDDFWQLNWNESLEKLKAQISAMPVYSGEEETSSGTNGALSESQANILRDYDRDSASRELDEMIRRYIANHNAIYKGIIYLQSPYRSLALFALILALSFDLSGFIFGFVAQGNSTEDQANQADSDPLPVKKDQSVSWSASSENINEQTEWSILKTLAQYVVLTGDYESRDGDFYYKAFKDGLPYHWTVKDTVPYKQGIYIQEEIDGEWTKGKPVPEEGQELLFASQTGGPKDGIYTDSQLIFDEGSLILVKDNQQNFLASIDEYVPVHSYRSSQGENRTVPAAQLTAKSLDDQLIVVALNSKGTRVAAIYIVGHEEC